MKKNYTKIVLDLMMAITFVLLMDPRVLNGLPFHEIAGLVIGVAILTHIGLNYHWVVNTTKKIFDPQLPKKTRFSFLLNILLLISLAIVIVTGILISRVVFPSLAIQGVHSIRGLHSFFADATLGLVGLHIGVHWQWIIGICKKAFKSREGKLRKGVITSVVLSFIILGVGIEWYSSTASSNIPNQKQFEQRGEVRSFDMEDKTNSFQGPPPNGDFRGREGNNPFLDVLNYFAIWTAIIIPTYYVEKRILKKIRNQQIKNAAV